MQLFSTQFSRFCQDRAADICLDVDKNARNKYFEEHKQLSKERQEAYAELCILCGKANWLLLDRYESALNGEWRVYLDAAYEQGFREGFLFKSLMEAI